MEDLVMQDQLLSYYKGKRIFITGHTGFKGSWLMACLQLAEAELKGYALAPDYDNSLFSLLNPLHPEKNIIADIRDRERLKKEVQDFQPEFVFHLAAQPLVRRSYAIPAETFEVNVAGTANLLEAVRDVDSKCTIIVITTDKVYENREQDILYKEGDPLGGYDPYSASKACTELVVNSFRNSFFNIGTYSRHQKAIASARAGNVIGGGDWSEDRILPDIIRALQADQTIPVRNPAAVRPWQHVLEPITGYLQLALLLDKDTYTYSKAYNFGPLPGDHFTVRQLVETAIEEWGNGSWNDASNGEQPHEANLLKLDISLARNDLNWVPKLTAGDGARWAIKWYKQPESKRAGFTLEQVKNYLAL